MQRRWKDYAAVAAIALVTSGGAMVALSPQQLPEERPLEFSIHDLRDGMTVPHFSKVTGIAEEFLRGGVPVSPNLEIKLRYAASVVEMKREQFAGLDAVMTTYDMAWSEGVMEARNGQWSAGKLDAYVSRIMQLDERFVEVSEASYRYLRDEQIDPDEAQSYVRRMIGLAFIDHVTGNRPSRGAGVDPRLAVAETHLAKVMELHWQVHDFFMRRLTELDLADQGLLATVDERPEVIGSTRAAEEIQSAELDL